MRSRLVWGIGALLYGVFFAWYTGLRGPLTPDEIDIYVERMASANQADPEELGALRTFLEEDTGGDFIMVNTILMREKPLQEKGVRPDESSEEVLARYMEYMWPALLKRACHPVLAGTAVMDAPEAWGIENARRWSSAGMMRYRSRRDLMEIAATPEFNGPHEFKIAAIEKTIAFPIETLLNPGDPRLLMGLILFSLSAGAHLLLRRRSAG